MSNFTLHELQCFNAVVVHGGFQAAAERLHRSHPSVFAAVAKLERQLGLVLLDRSGGSGSPRRGGPSTARCACCCTRPRNCGPTPRSWRWARRPNCAWCSATCARFHRCWSC
ncbi:LysR family transcriptional regulator [Streptomyces sp. RM99]|uniref:helix-turn-helix domain-containing protein n=1 Tax=Streptomyces sp. RM99 TaxID=2824897 RepID=UPI001FFD35F6|nr:LysR family transcriptional regulator [Streptomyces sp. RM99]